MLIDRPDNTWLGPDHTREMIQEARRIWPPPLNDQSWMIRRYGHECGLIMAGELERLLEVVKRLQGRLDHFMWEIERLKKERDEARKERDLATDELVRVLADCRPYAATTNAIREADAGKNMTRYQSTAEMLEDLPS